MATPRARENPPPSRRQYVRQPLPGWTEFLHPKIVSLPPTGSQWLHEIKLDGYRLQVRVEDGQATVFSRRGLDWTDALPELAGAAATLPDCILDGELCHLDPEGKPQFSGLRSAMGKRQTAGLVFFAFDILWRGADNLRTFALTDRKDILTAVLANGDAGEVIRCIAPLPNGGGAALMTAACRMGLEGIVSKRRDSKYVSGRSDLWVKALCISGHEFVIGGWEQEAGRLFKAILVGVYDKDVLTYVGTLQRGFSAAPDLARRLAALESKTNPFKAGDPPRAHVRWVRPELVARAEFREWTASGKIRHASFRGLRDDKDPRDVRRERPDAPPPL